MTVSKILLSLAMIAAPATAQVTSMTSNNPLPKRGDPNQIVCEREETTGTRLGGHKVCLTVAQWQDKQQQHRETLEGIQRMGTSVGCQEGQGCP